MDCIFIIGGAKSGKSRYALSIGNKFKDKKKVFIATAQPIDPEMEEKIRRHREERGKDWITIEEPLNISDRIKELSNKDVLILIDCLTLWLNNLLIHNLDPKREIENLVKSMSSFEGMLIVVSNEVGMGIVPQDELTRRYRDLLGYLNQEISHLSNKVIFMMAGIPIQIK